MDYLHAPIPTLGVKLKLCYVQSNTQYQPKKSAIKKQLGH